jgi:ComF family protein
MVDTLLSLVAPHPCLGCGILGSVLCHSCKYDIVTSPISTKFDSIPHLDAQWAVGVRHGLLQKVTGAYKFTPIRAAAKPLAELLRPLLPRGDIVLVPIPTTSAHERERGFDHIGLLVRELHQITTAPVARCLVRRRTSQQKHASRKQRFAQAKNSFELRGSLDPGAMYVLIDDIVTTCATIQAAAAILKKAGARFVSCAVLAVQPLD